MAPATTALQTSDDVRLSLDLGRYTPRKEFARAIGRSDRAVRRLNLPVIRIGRMVLVDVPGARSALLIWSNNGKRRHMSKGQMAMVAAMDLSEANRSSGVDAGISRAAKASGVSRARIQQALLVREHAPHLVARIAEMHARGKTQETIAAALKMPRPTVGHIIERLAQNGTGAELSERPPPPDPEPVPSPSHSWLLAWQRDRAIYALAG